MKVLLLIYSFYGGVALETHEFGSLDPRIAIELCEKAAEVIRQSPDGRERRLRAICLHGVS